MENQQNLETINQNQKKSGKRIFVLLCILLCALLVWLFIGYINNYLDWKIFNVQSDDVCGDYYIPSVDFNIFRYHFSGEARKNLNDIYSRCEYKDSNSQGYQNIIKYKFDWCRDDLHMQYIPIISSKRFAVCVWSSLTVNCIENVDLPKGMENVKEEVTLTWDWERRSDVPNCVVQCVDWYNFDEEKGICVKKY